MITLSMIVMMMMSSLYHHHLVILTAHPCIPYRGYHTVGVLVQPGGPLFQLRASHRHCRPAEVHRLELPIQGRTEIQGR